jgi:hypothetical protein
MRAEGGQIYQGNRFETSVTESARGRVDVSNLANKGVQEQLDRNKQQALTLYEQGLKLTASQSMEEAYNNYQNDPESLKAELNKISEKMTAEIPDMQTKVAFRANFITQSGSLINRAQANYDKIQYQKKKSSYFDTIQANNKSIAMALNNAFNGTGTADDLVNYQTAIKQNIDLINSRNDDGTYIFTDAQRLSMSNAVDKLAAESFSNALNDMDDDKRTQTLEALNKDSMILLQGEEDGEVKQLNLKDAFTPEVYADMKKSATILDNKIKKKELAEWRQNKAYSAIALMKEPSEQNYKIWEYYNQDASEEKKKRMQEIAGFIPDEETITTFEGADDLYDEIKELSSMPNDTMAEKDAIEDKAMQIVQKAHQSNITKDEEGRFKVSSQDLDRAKQLINNTLSDNVFKKQISELPDMSTFRKLVRAIDAPIMHFSERINAKSKIGDIAQATMRDIQNIVMTPDLDNDTKRKEIQRIYKSGMEDAIRAKYFWIPDLQNKPLVENETILNINGTQYLYKGIGDDILLEIKE